MINRTLKMKLNMDLYFLIIAFIFDLASAVEVTEVVVPEYADFRDSATLSCTFDIGTEELHSVKWYKDEQEFFRFVPRGRPSIRNFLVLGVRVPIEHPSVKCDLQRCQVILTQLSKTFSSGVYKCEISSEAPTFAIAMKSANMTVIGLPKEDPKLLGLRDMYTEGDVVAVNCTAAPSDPPSNIKFYINDKQAWPQLIVAQRDSTPDVSGLVTRSVSLRMLADRKLFSPRMRLRCESEVLTSPVRTVAQSAALKVDGSYQLRNQKLEWPSSRGVCSTAPSLMALLCIFIILVREKM